jgi:hypothetical protein
MAWLYLLAALACGAGAYFVGRPAWTDYQRRDSRDLNAERYLAWRGRAAPPGSGSLREGPTTSERRRLWLAALLAGVAVALLIGFFISS